MKNFLIACCAILCFSLSIFSQIPTATLINVVKAEDERRFDKTLEDLLESADEKIRVRAALAAGRIGDERAVPFLVNLLEKDLSAEVRATAAFALGEIESIAGANAILKVLADAKNDGAIRARVMEAAGKIAAANPKDEKSKLLGEAILDALDFEDGRHSKPNRDAILFGLTAALRARPEEADLVAAKFLTHLDARIRADAANTLSRLRAKNANEQLRAMLLSDDDANARANAARALGAAEDKNAFDLLLEAATTDEDSRVRVSAIRSLGSLKDKRAADKLLERGTALLADYKKSKSANPPEKSELLEIATTLGRILTKSNSEDGIESSAITFLDDFRAADKFQSPEIEIALAQLASDYLEFNFEPYKLLEGSNAKTLAGDWRIISSLAQGLGESAKFEATDGERQVKKNAEGVLREPLEKATFLNTEIPAPTLTLALPDVLRAFAAHKTDDLGEILRRHLKNRDVFIRAAAAELLGETKPDAQTVEALNSAFDYALLNDKQYNDAQLAILDALQKQGAARASLLLALKESDYLVRQKALQIIKTNDLAKDDTALKVHLEEAERNRNTVKPFNSFSRSKLGVILNTNADYTRAVSRKNGTVKAVLITVKGAFTIDLTPEDAPLTVDNFIKLAKSGYFNGLAIHRVVPNFVMQDGDPRGDGNGGPGYSIRCEINTLEYERGAVGMALSGKDTGGSQWFATHSAQPHLDGGYTVFGRVNESDMKVVDKLVRGDKILTVKILEGRTAKSKK